MGTIRGGQVDRSVCNSLSAGNVLEIVMGKVPQMCVREVWVNRGKSKVGVDSKERGKVDSRRGNLNKGQGPGVMDLRQ